MSAKAKTAAQPKICGCGCNESTRGGKFLPGHDARLKGALKKRAAAGDLEAAQELLERGWDLESLRASKERRKTQPEPKERVPRSKRENTSSPEDAARARAMRLQDMISVARRLAEYQGGRYRGLVQVTTENYAAVKMTMAAGGEFEVEQAQAS